LGGSPNLLLPVGPRRMSSWATHQNRNPPSQEPGTDFYCPIGTPVYAPADGRIYGFGTSIIPATGLWNGIDFTNGFRFRAMHFSQLERTSGLVERGELIAYSGATGYGKKDWSNDPNTGGSHVHATLWDTQQSRFGYRRINGKLVPYTVDLMNYIGGDQSAGSGNTPIELETDMRSIHSPNRTWANIGPGFYTEISEEAFNNSIWPRLELNDRQYDLAVSTSTGAVNTRPVGGMFIAKDNAGTRTPALIGPGYVRALSSKEELDNASALADRTVIGNTRQFDLWVSMALAGDSTGPSSVLTAIAASENVVSDKQVKAIADAVAAALGKPSVTIDIAAIARAVNDDHARRLAS
jgi:murein DD-endopeptidase MepM/ murein hydrolase activator NlpD